MTTTAPMLTAPPVVGPRPGRLTRLRLQQPLRLFVWPALLLLLLGLVLQAAATPGGWTWLLLVELPGVFAVALSLELARRQTFTLVDVMRKLVERG